MWRSPVVSFNLAAGMLRGCWAGALQMHSLTRDPWLCRSRCLTKECYRRLSTGIASEAPPLGAGSASRSRGSSRAKKSRPGPVPVGHCAAGAERDGKHQHGELLLLERLIPLGGRRSRHG